MSWYRTGTINLTKDSASITGVNTKWAQAVNGVMPGMMMIMPDNKLYEIKNVVSDTSLVLVTAYTGATATALAYAVVTTYEGDLSQFSARFSALLTAMGGSRADMYNWLTSTAATILVAKDDGTTVTVKTLKAFTDEQAKFATKNANGLIPIEQGGTNAKDAKGIRENAGLGTTATLDSGTGIGNVPQIIQRGYGRHVSSMYMEQLSRASLGAGQGFTDEYMIAAIDPGTTEGINPSGFCGRFMYSRGGKASSNNPGILDVLVQTSYRGTVPLINIVSPMQGARNLFTGLHSATYKGRKVYLLRLPSSGGPFDNGVFFDGVIYRDNDDNEIFSVVRLGDLTDVVDMGIADYLSFPVYSPTRRKVGTDSGDVPYVGAFGLGVAGLNRPASAASGFISDTANTPNWAPANGAGWQSSYANQRSAQLYVTAAKDMYFRWNQEVDAMATNTAAPWLKVYHTGNTTKGSDGTLKTASPVARIASPDSSIRSDIDEDSFEWAGYGVVNDKARGVEIIRDEIGVYRVTGAKSLASSGWRLLPPRDPDGSGDLGVVTAEQLDDEVIISLFRRKMVLENGEIVVQPGEPIDVPANSWIDVRLDMSESTIPDEPEQPLDQSIPPLTQPEQ